MVGHVPSSCPFPPPSLGKPRARPERCRSQALPPASCHEVSSLPPNFGQRSDSILRTWDAFSRRKDCEILGRQLQALPAPAGGLVKTLQEDGLWIKCPKAKIIFALLKWIEARGEGSNLIKKRRNLLYVSQLWF